MEFQHIKFEHIDNVAVLTLNMPDSLNALTRDMLAEIELALELCDREDSGTRCLLLTGEGRAFSAGMNLGDPEVPKRVFADGGRILETVFTPLLLRMRDLSVPIVTALNGLVVGVSVGIALMGDMIVASRSSYLLQPFANVGLIPDGGATYLLPRLLGKARAFELFLLNDRLPAEKALEWGLINAVHDDDKLLEEAMALAQRLAQGPTQLFAMTRKAVWEGFDNSFAEQLLVERNYQRAATRTEDSGEAMRAFFGKRAPDFTGR